MVLDLTLIPTARHVSLSSMGKLLKLNYARKIKSNSIQEKKTTQIKWPTAACGSPQFKWEGRKDEICI